MESGLIKSNSIGNLVDENDRRIHFIQLQFEQDSIDVLGLIKQLKAVSSIDLLNPTIIFLLMLQWENKQPIELKESKAHFQC